MALYFGKLHKKGDLLRTDNKFFGYEGNEYNGGKDLKIKKIAILLFTVAMIGITTHPSYAAEASGSQRLNIKDVLKPGDIYENKITDEIVVKEVVTKVYEDGTFATKPIGEMLDESSAYSSIEFETEECECLTVYLRNEMKNEFGKEFDYLEKLSDGDVIQACIQEDNGTELTALEVIFANNADGSFMTKHINIVTYD